VIEGFATALLFAIAVFIGWTAAHNTVAYECRQLGGFYVGKTVYECKVKGETK
jgi:hypothetical protein